MSLYESNMELLKNNSVLYDIISYKLNNIKNDGYNYTVLPSKIKGMYIKTDGNSSIANIHSIYNPITEAERWVKSVNTNVGLIVILGLGLGYHIQYLKEITPRHVRICIIEPSQNIFLKFIENVDIREIVSDNVTILLDDNIDSVVHDVIELSKENLLDSVEFKIFPGYENKYYEFYKSIIDNYQKKIKQLRVNIKTTDYFKDLWLVNYIKNVLNINGAFNGKYLKGLLKDIPAIIVSAGPSLNKNINQLADIRDKAAIIAGGSAIGILKKKNIVPHFMVAIDASPLEADIFNEIDFKDVGLIYLNRLYFKILDDYKEKKILFIDEEDKLSEYFSDFLNLNLQKIPPDQTVAGINVILACYLGCNPIIFVGQDFAFTNLEIHADGAVHMYNFQNDIEKSPEKFMKTKDIYGNDIYTSLEFYTPKLTVEEIIKKRLEGRKFINATEGGLGINYCENMYLKDVINNYLNEERYIQQQVDFFYNNTDNKINITKDYMRSFFDHIYLNCLEVLDIAEELYYTCLKLEEIIEKKQFGSKKYSELAVIVNRLDQQISENVFYNKFILGCIEQNINIHKVLMNQSLNKANNINNKNKIKLKSIKNQCIETISFCKNIDKLKNVVIDPYFD